MLGRLVDRHIRDRSFVVKQLHPTQHNYQAGKSVETSLHQLVVRVEKVLDQRELVLAFLNIKGAYNYGLFDSVCTALCDRGVDSTIVLSIRATLEGRLTTAPLNDVSVGVAVARGC
jgi:hypothetical protein